MTEPLPILYRDEDCVAINKPAGMFVHRTRLGNDQVVVLQQLRDQLGQYVYPVHRLDRGTSGVLLFGLSSKAARFFCEQLAAGAFGKDYLAVVRGYTAAAGRMDHPLVRQHGNAQQRAETLYQRLATAELPTPVGRYATARYSLVLAQPLTGRTHQLRRHFKHLSHPIIGDSTHGDLRHNRLFRETLQVDRLFLHAIRLRFPLPGQPTPLCLAAPLDNQFQRIMAKLAAAPATTGAWSL